MKTAVQKLIDHLKETYILTEETRCEFKKALEQEYDNIIDAFNEGVSSEKYIDGHQYYSQTFKND